MERYRFSDPHTTNRLPKAGSGPLRSSCPGRRDSGRERAQIGCFLRQPSGRSKAVCRNALRQALAVALSNQRVGVEEFWRQITLQPLNAEEQAVAAAFPARRPADTMV